MKTFIVLSAIIISFSLIISGITAKPVQKDFCKNKADGLYPDPENCSSYYSCSNRNEYLMPCPDSLIYDTAIKVCNWPSQVNSMRRTECQIISISTTVPPLSTPPKKKDPPINPKLPRSLELRFDFGTKSVSLNVTQKPGASDQPSQKILVGERGRITEWKTNETYAVYENPENSALIVASTDKKKNDSLTYQGNFKINGKSYNMKPKGALNIVPAARNDARIVYKGNSYTITEAVPLPPTCPDVKAARTIDNTTGSTIEPSLMAVMADSYSNSSSSSGKQHYGVELFIATDYSIFYKWYLQSTATTDQGRKYDAIQNIRYYFAHIVNGMDNRYNSINESDFDIYIRLVGYFIATTPSDSPWTEGYGIKTDGMYSDINMALVNFTQWISTHASLLPNFDAASLFSSNLLYYGLRDNGQKNVISGLAWIEGACNQYKTSVNYEFGEYSTIETAAHELGHNLGAQHDDYAYNSCDRSQQFIMASSPTQLTNDTFNNPFHFSKCSINYFRQYTSKLNRQGTNCLLNPAVTTESTDFQAFLRQYPGQRYNPDKQCQLMYGQNSFYCAGGSRDRSICREMQCWSPDDSICFATTEQRAYDGTTCANGSWCYMGDCVKNPMAPSAPSSCIYGDYRGLISIDSTHSYSCSQIGSYQQWRCYDSGFSTDCCYTCAVMKDASKPGCEYGDREPDWCNAYLRTYDCYDPVVRTRCCSTCSRYYRNLPGCEYGDRDNSWCPSVTNAQCYQASSTCCETCRRYFTGVSGCEYGDKITGCSQYTGYCLTDSNIYSQCCATCNAAYPGLATTTTTTKTTTPTTTTAITTTTVAPTPPASCPLGDGDRYCTTMPIYECYTYASLCCVTCPKHYNASRTGCEYGDQVPWCSTYVQGPTECERPEVKLYCCDTCTKYNSGVLTPACNDKAEWCNGLFPGYCYDSQTADTCCKTCSSKKSTNSNCLYGDKFTWCASQYCETNRVECCTTCQ